jgi:hypothetical protein
MPEKRTKCDREFSEGAVGILEQTGKPIAPLTHPLLATTSDQTAVWVCPADQATISRIGSL